MTTAPFPLYDVPDIVLLGRVWGEYATAIGTTQQALTAKVDAIKEWQGQRAELFAKWWAAAGPDLVTIKDIAGQISEAYLNFVKYAQRLNDKIDAANSLAARNHLTMDFPGSSSVEPVAGTWYWKAPADTKGHNPPPGEVVRVAIDGFDVGPFMPGDFDWRSTWFNDLSNQVQDINGSYNAICEGCNNLLRETAAAFGRLKQITRYSKGSGTAGSDGTASLRDPIWNQLTGGSVFRPKFPPGFTGNPLNGSDVPSWYDPSLIDKIIGDALPFLEYAAEAITSLLFGPEAAGVLEVAFGAYDDFQIAEDLSKGDLQGLIDKGVNFLLDKSGASGAIAGLFVTTGLPDDAAKALTSWVEGQIESLHLPTDGGKLKISAGQLTTLLQNTQNEANKLLAPS